MAIFRLPLSLNQKISFYKLMGCGKNGTFDKTPDLQQWAVLTVFSDKEKILAITGASYNSETMHTALAMVHGRLITAWWKFFGCEVWMLLLQPLEGHGLWDGKTVFGNLPKNSGHEGTVAVLTRATIRLQKMGRFWQHVEGAANGMATAPGFITSLGVGEVPWIKQATFSIWESKDQMKAFAYKLKDHAEIVRKTRQEKWYSEEMFTRFAIKASVGSIKGKNPLTGLL